MSRNSSQAQSDIAELASILQRTDIFFDLTEPQLEMIAGLCTEENPKQNELIIQENTAGTEMYIIASGEVEILVSPPPAGSGAPPDLPVATLSRGQTFGEMALVDQGLRSASVRCVSRECRLLVIPRDRLIRLCDSYPDLGYRLMRNIASDLAFKIRSTDFALRERGRS
jgi:CRP-like cAMP-binding protein